MSLSCLASSVSLQCSCNRPSDKLPPEHIDASGPEGGPLEEQEPVRKNGTVDAAEVSVITTEPEEVISLEPRCPEKGTAGHLGAANDDLGDEKIKPEKYFPSELTFSPEGSVLHKFGREVLGEPASVLHHWWALSPFSMAWLARSCRRLPCYSFLPGRLADGLADEQACNRECAHLRRPV